MQTSKAARNTADGSGAVLPAGVSRGPTEYGDLPLPGLLRQRAGDPETRDRTFLESTDGHSLTFGEAHHLSLVWANALDRAGVEAGDVVATLLPNSTDAVTIWLGIASRGAVEVPINTEYRGYMLEYVLTNCEAKLVIIAERYLDLLTEIDPVGSISAVVVPDATQGIPPLDYPVISGDDFLGDRSTKASFEDVQPWDIAGVTYTSGTTGASKGVLLPWRHLYWTAVEVFPLHDLDENDACYNPWPPCHYGGKHLTYLAALLGAKVVISEKFRTARFWEEVRRHGCTLVVLPIAAMTWLYEQPAQPDDADNPLRIVLTAPVIQQYAEFQKRFDVRLITAYAMTETSVITVGHDISDPTSCGTLSRNALGLEARIVDHNDEEVPVGTAGELVVRSSVPWALSPGYFKAPEKTAEVWRNGWFHTGDALRRDEAGNYYFVSRLSGAIRRRAENISPFEVEAAVNEHPDVLESAAIGVPSEFGEDEVKVVVVCRPDATLSHPELLEFLSPRMPRFMVPRYVEFVDELPRTQTHKVDLGALRKQALNDSTWDREAAAESVSS